MKRIRSINLGLVVALALASGLGEGVCRAGSGFTYQGSLQQGGQPANGVFDLRFALYAAAVGGQAVAGPVTNRAVTVRAGVFTAGVDFGPEAFDGQAGWLEVSVRSGTNDYTVLNPRQALTPTPYAVQAATVAQVPANRLTGTLAEAQLPANVARLDGPVQFTGRVVAPAFSGDGSGLTNLPPPSDSNTVRSLIAASLTNANVIYVDALAGNDATGQRGTAQPFATLAAALSNVVNDTVVVLKPGLHKVVCVDQDGDGDRGWTAPAHLMRITNFTLVGYGATVIASNFGYAFTLTDCQEVVIRGVRWRGDYESWYFGKGLAGCLGMGGANHNVTIADCVFESWPDQAITCLGGTSRNTSGLRVLNNTFKDIGVPEAPWVIGGLPDGTCVSGTIEGDCIVAGNRTEGRIIRFFEYENAGLLNPGSCTNILVINNVLTGLWDWGILFSALDGYVAHNVRISGNLIEYPQGFLTAGLGAIFVSGVVGGTISGNQVINYQSWVYGAERAGISVQSSERIVIENNLLEACGPVAISAGTGWPWGGDHITIRNNSVYDPVTWGIAAGATNVLIEGNHIHNLPLPFAVVAIGLASSSDTGTLLGGAVKNAVIRNNILSGTADPAAVAIFVCGTDLIPRLVADNNDNETKAEDYVFWPPGQTMLYRGQEAFSPSTAAQASSALAAARAAATQGASALAPSATALVQPSAQRSGGLTSALLSNVTDATVTGHAAQAEAGATDRTPPPGGNRVVPALPEEDEGTFAVVFGVANYTVSSTNDLRFVRSTHWQAGGQVIYCVLPCATDRTLTFNREWVFLSGPRPAKVPAHKAALFTFRNFGSSESNVFVSCEIEP